MANAPHFDLPFRLVGHSVATVEENTWEDVRNCVYAALLTPFGWRPEAPEFGTDELTLQKQPLDVGALEQQISRSDPRALVYLSQDPSAFDATYTRARAALALGSGDIGA